MIIKCPSCETKFNLPDAKFQEGRKVRCSQCKDVFELTFDPLLNPGHSMAPQAAAAPPAPSPAPAPEQSSGSQQPPTPQADAFFGDGDNAQDSPQAEGGVFAAAMHSASTEEANAAGSKNPNSQPPAGDEAAAKADAYAEAMAREVDGDPYSIDIGEAPKKKAGTGKKITIPRGAQPKKSPLKLAVTLFLFIVFAVGAAGALLWVFAPDMLPSPVRDILGEQPAGSNATATDSQVNKEVVKFLEIVDAEQFFIKNDEVGDLLVIKGSIINKSTNTLDLIKLEANLIDEENVRLDTRQQLIGNSLTEFQLKNLKKEEIEKALENPVGITAENTMISPGSKVPFMVIFYNVPENVVDYQVIIQDAKLAGQQ